MLEARFSELCSVYDLTVTPLCRWMGFDLLLDVAEKLMGVRKHDERFWRASVTVKDHRTEPQHTAPEGLLDGDAFDAGQHQIQRAPVPQAGLDQHSPVRDCHFGGIAFRQPE